MFCAFGALMTNAQTLPQKTIKVKGTAEMEIVPDEIFLSVTLREYTKDKKKFNIEELEARLINYINKVVAVESKDVKYDDMSAYIAYARKKNKDEVISKSYDIKLKTSKQIYQVYSVMDSLGITKAFVKKYSHSKMDEYKKQVKIDAIKAAQAKAGYLLEAIGSKAGKPVSVNEKSGFVTVDDGTTRRETGRYGMGNSISQSYMLAGGESDSTETIVGKTIKLSYEIEAEFDIL